MRIADYQNPSGNARNVYHKMNSQFFGKKFEITVWPSGLALDFKSG